jgi:hypothetical protein
MDVRIFVNDVEQSFQLGAARVGGLRTALALGGPSECWIALHETEFERFLADADEINVTAGLRLTTCAPLVYRPHPKHKRQPARGKKGSLCPRGVDGQSLLALSYLARSKRRRRWATHDGHAYCAMDDNAGAWHGYPVPITDVPVPVWRDWLRTGKIRTRDL